MSVKGFDIAIVGGGVIGLALARTLVREGARVAVFDAAEAGGGAIPSASHAAAGMLAPSFEYGELPAALSQALYRFGARGLALWREYAAALEEETGLFIDYRPDGMLAVAYGENDSAPLEVQASMVSALGGAAKMISGDEARVLEPALSEAVIAALHAPQDAQVDPRRLVKALKASLAEKKTPSFAVRLARVDRKDAGYELVGANGERFEADKVVLAAGAVSGLVPMGLVYPVKGAAVAIAVKDGLLSRVVRAPGAYLCPKADGRLVIGATEEIGRDDLEVEPAAVTGLRTNGVKAVPALAGAPEIERWAGLRPGTPDGAPILGQDGEGRFLALGHYRNGILHAPAAAEAMAALILGREAPVDIAPFGLGRFGPAQHG
ncbi:glycine oxidase ThiO [Hyphococcus luteus]|uniref:Glycine oxidase ThiO n=1 Tax=Hyphococcus luteus TaxID=2058213 RepID=A0A2S7K980_9PROT|nr:glycine oxidase ThiO [Marinicaulis flavus]PQA89033.1 glycine oxidase ThiO [Marinicaulis flavus]